MAFYRTAQATVVIPVLRQEDAYLERCVRSALGQTARCEVIVVTSPRTPPANIATLAALARGHDDLRIVQREREGFAAGLNTGIRCARTERLGFLLSDDWLEPGAVEACLAEDAEIVSTNMAIFAADGRTPLAIRNRRTRETFERLATPHDRAAYLGHFLFFRREALLAVGGVDESVGLTGPDDFDLLWTLMERGARVRLVEAALYNYRDHPGERLTLRPAEAQIRDLERILDKHGVTEPERGRLIRRHARWYGRTLLESAREIERQAAEAAQRPCGPASTSGPAAR